MRSYRHLLILLLAGLLVLPLGACASPFGEPRFAPAGLADVVVLTLLADASGSLYAGTSDGVHRSDDHGRSWQPVAGFPAGTSVPGLSRSASGLLAATSQGVFKSADGRRWYRLGAGLPTDAPVLSVTVDPTNTRRLVAGTGRRGIFRSLDGGLTWQPASAGLPRELPVYTITPDPAQPGRLLAGTTGAGLYRSDDGGTTWQRAGDGIPISTNVFALAGSQDGWLVAGTSVGLFRSTDGGETWQWEGRTFSQTRVIALAQDPTDPQRLVAGADDGAYISADAGQTWQRLAEGLPPDDHVGSVVMTGQRILVGAGQVWAFDSKE